MFSIISVALILLSVGTSCALTLPQFSEDYRAAAGSSAPARDATIDTIFTTIDFFCGILFTFELLLRIIFCPRRRVFFRMVTNWIDILSVMPFYLRILDRDSSIADALLMIRLLRLFRFFRLLYGLQILLHTLKASSYELGLLLLILLIPVVLFSSIIYYIERTMDGLHTKFRSIPESFWWSLITMTTVGYGDMTPKTWVGKIIGGACAICGLLVVALPISIIGSNFNLYYAHAQARLKLPRKRNKVLLSSITSDFSNRGNFSGVRRRGLRMRSQVGLETGEEENLLTTMHKSNSPRQNSYPKQTVSDANYNTRTWSLPSTKSDNGHNNDAKTSPTSTRPTRERKYSRNERVIPKLGDLPEKDESEENECSDNQPQASKPTSSINDNSRNSLNVTGVTRLSSKDRLPLWIAENVKSSRMRSFSVPTNTHKPFPTAPPRKTQSQSSHLCERCSLPRETNNLHGKENHKSSSMDICCCSDTRGIAQESGNNSMYTIYIPGVDEGVQVSMESLPPWSRELPFNGGSPVQLELVPHWKTTLSDDGSDPENKHELDERETLVSELGDSPPTLDNSRRDPGRELPLLFIDMSKKPDKHTDNETSIWN